MKHTLHKTVRIGKRTKRVLIILGVLFVLTIIAGIVLYYFIEDSVHPKTISKFKASAHFVSATPKHGETITSLEPIHISFAYPLTKLSTISVTNGDWEDSVGETLFSKDTLTMSKQLNKHLHNGIYTVNYTACFIDNYCDFGYFQFRIAKPQ